MTGSNPTQKDAGTPPNVTRRLLALDIGDVRTGVAMSDSTNALASPVAVLVARTKESLLDELLKFVDEYSVRLIKELGSMFTTSAGSIGSTQTDVLQTGEFGDEDDELFLKRTGDYVRFSTSQLFECVVIGLPLDQSGNETVRAAKVREWGEYVASGIELRAAFVDERYTTRRMIAADKASKRRAKDGKANIDARAAAEILQSYIDAKRFTGALMEAEKTKIEGMEDK